MPKHFSGFGISLLYPDSWQADEELDGESVSLQSPDSSFMTITRFANRDESTAGLERAVKTMQDEYDEVERESLQRQIAGCELQGMILRFVYLDLIVASQLLTFSHGEQAYLIQIQAEDREHDRLLPVFDAVITSLCQNLQA